MERNERTPQLAVMDNEYARDNPCSVIFWPLGVGPFSCAIAHQNDPLRIEELLCQRYSANTTFGKAAMHCTLVRTQYTGRLMQEHVARWEWMSTQLDYMDAPTNKSFLSRMFVKSYGNCSSPPLVIAFLALLYRVDHIWQPVSSLLLQKLELQQHSRQMSVTNHYKVLLAQQNNNKCRT